VEPVREACGIFGIFAPGEDVARLTYFALFALQHRGQESAGVATTDGHQIRVATGMGLVSQVFREESLALLKGNMAIGHTRYSTTGSCRPDNAQPLLVEGPMGPLALGHNGNLVNAEYLRAELEAAGRTFCTSTDSEVIAHLIQSAPDGTWPGKVRYAMRRLEGAYSLVLLTRDCLMAVRDPLGVRPLCLGRVNGGWAVASESCALDHIGGRFLREVEPGEIVLVRDGKLESYKEPSPHRALCIFEFIYFARPDSLIQGRLLHLARQGMGVGLAREHPAEADLVMGVPDSSIAAAIGYSREAGIPFTEGLLKNRYVGRTFIEPDQRLRELGVKLKFNPLPEVLKGKRLVVVDDSIVRGTTTPRVVALLRRAGVKEVHLRICAPPIRYPCFFGVDMARRFELIAAQKTIPQICQQVGADSLGYLSIDGLLRAVDLPRELFCLACFTGEYPIPVQMEMDKLALEALETGRR
jgi:amidophosphoribosyltransferase